MKFGFFDDAKKNMSLLPLRHLIHGLTTLELRSFSP